MPLSQFERSIVLFNLHVEMVPVEAAEDQTVDMSGAIRMIADAWHGGRAWMTTGDHAEDDENQDTAEEKKSSLIQIREIDWDKKGFVTILFHHGDANAADPALLNFDTGSIRTAGKTDTEGL